jgi:PIN domain nuclease of toxin-antitoxin system
LSLGGPFDRIIAEQLLANEIALLPIGLPHIARVVTLPFHHRDPFDRLLICQALVEDMALVSNQALFNAYEVRRFW